MGKGRYAGTRIIDGNHYAAWSDPTRRDAYAPDILEGVQTVDHVLVLGERLDTLAHRYYNDAELWWVIAMANRIADPFALVPGTRLRVPSDARSILDKVQR